MTEIQKNQLIMLHSEGYNDSEIAKKLGVAYSTVSYHRCKTYKLPNNIGKKVILAQYKILELINQRVPLKRISEITGINTFSLRKFCKNYGLPDLRSRYKDLFKFGKREKSILIGIMLGDGTIEKNANKKSARFSTRHCENQKHYTFYIYNTLKSLKPRIKKVKIKEHILNGKTIKNSYQYECKINTHQYITELANIFYKNSKKIIPFELLSLYTKESLAFHFMDDGSKTVDSKGNINGFIISTQSFTKEENIKFIGFLKGKFDLNCTYIPSNNVIRVSANSVNRFIYLVSPYIIDTLKYKISPIKTS